jgi:large subunit ribosomal protein L15
VVASRASRAAIDAIESNGGKVVCKYYNTLALRDCVQGRSDRISAAPTRREDIGKLYIVQTPEFIFSQHVSFLVWYGKHRNRGFISPTTLKSLRDLPFVEKRWELLANQLGSWKKQGLIGQKR